MTFLTSSFIQPLNTWDQHISKRNWLHSFIYSCYFYSASTSPQLLRGAPDTARILCRSFTPKRYRQLWLKYLPKVPAWRLEWDSNPRPFGRTVTNLPMSHHAPRLRDNRFYHVAEQRNWLNAQTAAFTSLKRRPKRPSFLVLSPLEMSYAKNSRSVCKL